MQFVATAISCVSRDRLAPAGEEHTHDACTNTQRTPFALTNFSLLSSFPKTDRANCSSYRVHNPSNLARGFHSIIYIYIYSSEFKSCQKFFFTEGYAINIIPRLELFRVYIKTHEHQLPANWTRHYKDLSTLCTSSPANTLYTEYAAICSKFVQVSIPSCFVSCSRIIAWMRQD